MPSKISTCNQALLLLGEKTIQSFDEDTPEARGCATFYDDSLVACLREIKPNFAIKRSDKLPSDAKPAFGSSQAANLPQDCVLVLDAWQGGQRLDAWVVEGRLILSEYINVQIRYVSNNKNTEVAMDSTFAKVLAAYLACELTYTLTNASSKLAAVQALLAGRSREAENQYGQEGSSPQVINTQLTAFR